MTATEYPDPDDRDCQSSHEGSRVPVRDRWENGPWSRGRVLALGGVLAMISACSPSLQGGDGFTREPLAVADYGIFDLGVADINDDGRLDIFTSNHSGPQSMLLNQGGGVFIDGFSNLKLDQDAKFPGLAVVAREPAIDRPGLFINWRGPKIVVRTHALDRFGGVVSGTMQFLEPEKLVIEEKKNFDVSIESAPAANGMSDTVIRFTGRGDGYFAFKPNIHAQSIRFRIDPGLSAPDIHVGPGYASPAANEFSMDMRDRHGMAWADYNGDGRTDIFVTRGGQSGMMWMMPGDYWDELLVRRQEGFEDMGRPLGLVKHGCSGRQAAWVDFDNDNRLDLYIVCGRGFQRQLNQLYRQKEDGAFVDVAAAVGLDIADDGIFEWIDVDSDGDLDLFWVDRDAYRLYLNEQGRFSPLEIGPNPAKRIPARLAPADFDGDGDIDVFAVSQGGNAFFINQSGTYVAADLKQWGLPRKGMAANWVDYDNDGRDELHLIPGGLYRQEGGAFHAIGGPDVRIRERLSPVDLTGARVSWFDADGDGVRDVVMAMNYVIKKRKWTEWYAGPSGLRARLGGLKDYWDVAYFHGGPATANHWLQVQLVGPAGNRPAIGARVTVSTPRSTQTRQVGAAEGSRYSQGHYRLYFGLGDAARADKIEVRWPDGRLQEIRDPQVDRLLVVNRETDH
ncbi:MAG: CRTAC1 family protein [Gammaproteobacteria bacterium]|nr:CRTAC1 family protein [Gammaproteobacteria bacterium]